MKRATGWRRTVILVTAVVLVLSACSSTDHPYSTYGAGAHGGGNR